MRAVALRTARLYVCMNNSVAAGITAVTVALWLLISCPAAATPKAAKSSFGVSARVLPVDCAAHSVQGKACAQVVITRDKPLAENPDSVVTIMVFY